MAITIRMLRSAAITSGGPNQDFVLATSPPGIAPKAAEIIVTACTTSATRANGARLSYGLFDGTRTFCVGTASDHNVAPNTCHRSSATQAVVLFGSGSALDALATASFITDGVRLNWGDLPATPVLVTMILYFDDGGDFQAYVGNWTASANLNSPTDITDPGFAPEVLKVLGSSTVANDITDSGIAEGRFQLGFARNSGATPPQASSNWMAVDAPGSPGSSDDRNWVSAIRANADPSSTGATKIQIFSFSATGFQAIPRTAGGAYIYGYLAMTFNGRCNHWIGVIPSPTIPTAPVDVAQTNPGFKPQHVQQLTTAVTQVNVMVNTSASGAGSYGIAGFTATEIFSNTISDDDASATAATESFSADDFRCRLDSANAQPTPPAQPNEHIASFVSFDPLGWTLHYTVLDNTIQRQWATLAIGEWTPAAQAVTFADRVDADLEVGTPEVVSY